MGIQIQNIGMNFNNNQMNMNIPNPNAMQMMQMQMMQMQMMMNMMNNNQWTLIFEEKNEKRTDIRISPDKTIREAINLYKIKSNTTEDEREMMFIHNGKRLHYDLKINQTGLVDNSIIIVVDPKDLIGG